MNRFISTAAIGYICLAVVVCVGLTQCGSKVTPEEVKAVSAACEARAERPKVEITSNKILMTCEK